MKQFHIGTYDFSLCMLQHPSFFGLFQVGRLAYEIMQTLHPDASDKTISLDAAYFFWKQNSQRLIADADHNSSKKENLKFRKGDVLTIQGRGVSFSPYGTATNTRTGQKGLYPRYKVHFHHHPFQFPNYVSSK